MKTVLAFGPKQLARLVSEADFDTLAAFFVALAQELPAKTHHVSKTVLVDNAAHFLRKAQACLVQVSDPYEPLQEK